ncbi:multidrug efflux SMR transporter [Oceanobacillus sp. CFH 90083]|uniref:DMT family transporter n=1 Tax=Oceanobacillus sp. CFH 90083 TaxID=2592336 RepID=UPI00128C0105|nr:multidrug efflux SMR transporter [Oceanobacillus sp. CFH 90083]
MHWIALIIAGFLEVAGVNYLKKVSMGNYYALIFFVLFWGLSFTLLGFAMNEIAMGTAYAIWTGIGTAGSALLGMFFYGESRDWKRLVCIACILSGAMGLKLIS